jgi:hypothetical protein
MKGGAIFKARSEAKELVPTAFTAINLCKNEVSTYAYNNANTLITEIERVLAEQLFKDSTDGMKGLLSNTQNTLTRQYKANVSIKQKDILTDLKAIAECLSMTGMVVLPKIRTNTYAQEEAARLNTYQLVAIGVKEDVVAGITKFVGKDIINPILRMADGISFRSVNNYQLHQPITTITEGAKRPAASTIRQQFVNIAGMVFFWRNTVAINKKNTSDKAKT